MNVSSPNLSVDTMSFLNKFIDTILIEIDRRVRRLNNPRITVDEIMISLRLIFKGTLVTNILKVGHDSLSKNKVEFLFSKKNYSSSCCLYMSGIIEYLYEELLDMATIEMIARKDTFVKIEHLVHSLEQDNEWKEIIQLLGIHFLSPIVHPSLYVSDRKKILRVQQKKHLLIPLHPFNQLIRKILEDEKSEKKISKNALSLLRLYTEQKTYNLLRSIQKNHSSSKVEEENIIF